MRLKSAAGDVLVSDLAGPQLAGGAELGGYALHVANTAVAADGDVTAELTDTAARWKC